MTSDFAIIGAGPAGCTAAILLARAGREVTLIEQHRFPRDKVCGECLSATGIEVLQRISLADALQTLHPIVLTHAAIHINRASVRLELPRPMWGISRRVLDHFLLEKTREAGATILQPARCEGVDSGQPLTLQFRRLPSNRIETWTGNQVLIADGKAALGVSPPRRTSDFGIKTHFENVDGPRDTIELFGCNGAYGGLAAIEGDRWNAAFSVPARLLREHRGDVNSVFDRMYEQNKMLSKRLKSARRTGDWLAAPLPRFPVRNHSLMGIIPIGNAAAALEPIGGEGMGLALRSAELAAESLLASRTDSLGVLYRQLWRRRRTGCRLTAQIVSRPGLGAMMQPLIEQFPIATRAAMWMMGK